MSKAEFIGCIENDGYKASLEPGKLYRAIPDSEAEKLGQVRVVDESGDDYLYPISFFLSASRPSRELP